MDKKNVSINYFMDKNLSIKIQKIIATWMPQAAEIYKKTHTYSDISKG